MLVFATASASANELTDNLTTTAKIENFCSISANDLNFGVVNLPLTAQSANSTMNVLCNNNTSYTIDLAYGGIYGQGTANPASYNVIRSSYTSKVSHWKINNSSGGLVAFFDCYTSNSMYLDAAATKLFGYASSGLQSSAKNDVCKGLVYVGATNFTVGQPYDYGFMNGNLKGDKLAYSIQIPDDSTKVWNAGNHSYHSIATGNIQEIQLKASLIPDKSSSKYIAQDTYLDTVTATISY